jgi:DNA-binding transcriptional LysR family regulator
MSYSVLEGWASLGIGATILPRSKVLKASKTAQLLMLEDGKPATITFETVWNKQSPQGSDIKEFLRYFKKTVP